jgi:hypothetical protein
MVADAKRLSANLHLSFAYISIGPMDGLYESLPSPVSLQWPCLEKEKKLMIGLCLTES